MAALEAQLDRPSRVRLLVGLGGRVEVEASLLSPQMGPAPSVETPFTTEGRKPVALARTPVDETSPWLFHKTTRREAYDRALAERPDVEDVILWNSRGEVTEACRSNVVLDLGGGLITPPISCGLLAGTFRAHLLASGQIREKAFRVADLLAARRVFLVNSVRGWQEVHVVGTTVP
jgi:para-aminobenzoate synthetase/4-amino-4-deoxychorismate lyase